MMGCSPGDQECDKNEKPPHHVTITAGFRMGQTEVTQAAYSRVMGENHSKHKGDNLPVEQVTWDDATKYCKAVGMRLPKEAEWEYAARAGTNGSRYGDLDAVAWYNKNSQGTWTTHPVALKQANAFGLYDMLGNVAEWTDDQFDTPYEKVVRGGRWFDGDWEVTASRRFPEIYESGSDSIGFRCVGNLR
jgi:formylglycine-generating enzyme